MIYTVSAIVSTFNSERYITGCLDDLLSQTIYRNNQLEIIIVNSGSEQDEESIICNYQKRHQHIKYVKTGRETLYAAWNRGIALATGKYLTNANTDDRHRSDALEVLSDCLDKNLAIDLVYADCYASEIQNETYNENKKDLIYKYPDYQPQDSLLCYQFGPQPMWRKSLHDKIGSFDGNFKAAGDYDFNIRLALKCKALHISEPLGLYLKHGNALSFVDDTAILEFKKIVRKYRTSEVIEKLYQMAGFRIRNDEERSAIYLDMAVRSLEFYPAWECGKPAADYDFAFSCFCKAYALTAQWPPRWSDTPFEQQGFETLRMLYEAFISKLPYELKLKVLSNVQKKRVLSLIQA